MWPSIVICGLFFKKHFKYSLIKLVFGESTEWRSVFCINEGIWTKSANIPWPINNIWNRIFVFLSLKSSLHQMSHLVSSSSTFLRVFFRTNVKFQQFFFKLHVRYVYVEKAAKTTFVWMKKMRGKRWWNWRLRKLFWTCFSTLCQ